MHMVKFIAPARRVSRSFAHRAQGMVKAWLRQVGALVCAGLMAATAHAQSDNQSTATAGSGTYSLFFSSRSLGAFNSPQVTYLATQPSSATTVFLEGSSTRYKAVSWSFAAQTSEQRNIAPTWESAFDYLNDAVSPEQGALTLRTFQNTLTLGNGDLSISNIKVDLASKTILADLSSTTAGFVNRTQYALWTFNEARGFTEMEAAQLPIGTYKVNASFHGLKFVDATEASAVFAKALKLAPPPTWLIRTTINAENSGNKDPLTGTNAYFGWLTMNGSVTVVDEAPAWMMLLAGGSLLGAWSRRKQRTTVRNSAA